MNNTNVELTIPIGDIPDFCTKISTNYTEKIFIPCYQSPSDIWMSTILNFNYYQIRDLEISILIYGLDSKLSVSMFYFSSELNQNKRRTDSGVLFTEIIPKPIQTILNINKTNGCELTNNIPIMSPSENWRLAIVFRWKSLNLPKYLNNNLSNINIKYKINWYTNYPNYI
jgi:hypothetical protein